MRTSRLSKQNKAQKTANYRAVAHGRSVRKTRQNPSLTIYKIRSLEMIGEVTTSLSEDVTLDPRLKTEIRLSLGNIHR